MMTDRPRDGSRYAADRLLVTGGTGTLGRVVMARLSELGVEAKVFSRGTGGDLLTGRGLTGAMSGVDTVIHCATTLGAKDFQATENLMAVMPGNVHLVYISIVGIDRIPLGYYRTKLASEKLIQDSGRPFTILRTTQFHDLIFKLFRVQRGPFLFAPKGFRFQPIGTGTVAARLVELAQGEPQGRVADMGGPEVHDATALARMYLRAKGSRRKVWSIPLPGRIARSFREGHNLSPNRIAGQTFQEFLDLNRA